MEIRSEKVLYGSLFRHVSQRYDVDVFLWGEDLLHKQLCIYAGKLKKLPEYDIFAKRLVSCGLVVVDPVGKRRITCHPVRYDGLEGIVYIDEKNFLAWWPLLKKSIRRGIHMAKQNGTERYITEGFHDQGLKEHTSMYQMLTYIAGYSWQKHLAAERMEEKPGAVRSKEMGEEFIVSKEAEKKSPLWNRLAAYIKGLLCG